MPSTQAENAIINSGNIFEQSTAKGRKIEKTQIRITMVAMIGVSVVLIIE